MAIRRLFEVLAIGAAIGLCSCGGAEYSAGGESTGATFTVSGTVSGLVGSGLVLQNNSAGNLAVTANGSFTFSLSVPRGTAYSVTVLTQPTNPSQTCTPANGSGTVSGANITDVGISCATDTFTIGGTTSGLAGTVVLQNNAGDKLFVTGPSFTFAAPIVSGAAYNVTVFSQPPGQTCTVSSGSGAVGAANVTNVAVTCTATTFSIGGTVTGLAGAGLTLRNNGSGDLAIGANGSFSFASSLATGATYNVTVLTQPTNPIQTCGVANGNGVVGTANVTGVSVTCVTQGIEFYLTFPDNACVSDPAVCQNAPVSNKLIIAAVAATSGEVTFNGAVSPFSIPALGQTVIALPATAVLTTNETVEAKGIHVTSQQPVSVHAISESRFSADGYLALSTSQLGTTYYVMSGAHVFPAVTGGSGVTSQFSAQ